MISLPPGLPPTRAYLELLRQFYTGHDEVLAGKWLLHHGRSFGDWAALPPGIWQGQPKFCYWNALRIARRNRRYIYCEGMATHIIPTQHAWLYDTKTGLVVDPTWERGCDYIGAPFRRDYLRRAKWLKAARYATSTPLMNEAEDFPVIMGLHPPGMWREEEL